MIKTVVGYPPNYNEICLRIGRPPREAVFTYGDTVYVPAGVKLDPGLEIHESTHMRQQELFGPAAWWSRYFNDREFRLSQEIEAYQRQYLLYRAHLSRKVHRQILRALSKALSGPLYGKLCTRQLAEQVIAGK